MAKKHFEKVQHSCPFGNCKSKELCDSILYLSEWLRQNTSHVGGDREKRALLHCWQEDKLHGHFGNQCFPFSIGNYPASRPNYTTPEHIRKGLSNLPQGHLLNYMHDSFIHNIQKLKMASMSLN